MFYLKVMLWLVQMGCAKPSRVADFDACIKCTQLENSLSYCILCS